MTVHSAVAQSGEIRKQEERSMSSGVILGKESDDVYEIGQTSRVTKLFSVTSKESGFSFKKIY